MFSARVALGFLLVNGAAVAQQYTISTFAGGGVPQNILGTSASLGLVNAIAVDSAGNLFMTSGPYKVVWRLDATNGLMTLVAGNGIFGFSGDNGPSTGAQLAGPFGTAVDSAGNIYIADSLNNRVRRISNGVITTVAGNGAPGFSGDNGLATNAQLNFPEGIAIDSAGNIYIADTNNNRIRKVSNGVITTVAGNGTQGFSGDNGPATSAQLYRPSGVAIDVFGNLYIADSGGAVVGNSDGTVGGVSNQGNNRIRRVTNGIITTVAGNGTQGFSGDNGPATSAQLGPPVSVAVDSAGSLYIADYINSRIRKVSNGIITTVAGSGTAGFSGDNGPATSAQLGGPSWVTVDSTGNLYIVDGYHIRKVPNGIITTVVGNGTFSFGGDNGPATSAQLDLPTGVAVGSAGIVYIADTVNGRIRKVSNGVITTVAGNGTQGFSGDNGPATNALLGAPYAVAVDSIGNLYIADTGNGRVRKVSNGVITTVAGSGMAGSGGDNGPATSAQLNGPYGIAVDSANNLYIADLDSNRIRKVSNGVITTVAGNGTYGFSGDGGPATSAQLWGPYGIAVDSASNLYIAEFYGLRIRKVSNGVITTVAGNGTRGFSGDNGPATSAQLDGPTAVAVDSIGSLYIAEYSGNRVRRISNGVITTVAGNGTQGFSGDNGFATSAQFYLPISVAVDSAGNVYVGDVGNNRIRVLTPSAAPALSVAAVTNAASNVSGPIAPGEIIVLKGSGLGPSQIAEANVGSSGLFGTTLAGTTVSINGVLAPMIYTSAMQVAAVVPYSVSGAVAQVSVSYQGETASALSIPLASSAPGIFTSDGTGKGQAAAVNQDSSLNTPGTPAHVGDVVVLFATGEGQTTPGGVDGKPATVPLPKPNLAVTVSIGGQSAQIQYAGGAPGEIAGLMQINAIIPGGIQTGNSVPVAIQVGNGSSQPGVTISVR